MVLGDGHEAPNGLCALQIVTHCVEVEIAERIAQRYFALERRVERERQIGGAETGGGELRRCVQQQIALPVDLGSLVVLNTSADRGFGTEKAGVMRQLAFECISFSRIDSIDRAERG